jgi:Tol biopolymer transport system component
VWIQGRLATVRADGKGLRWLTDDPENLRPDPAGACLSPDGRRLAYGVEREKEKDDKALERTSDVYLRAVDEKGPGTKLGVTGRQWAWSPDGRRLAVSDFKQDADTWDIEVTSWVVDLTTRQKKPLNLPEGHFLTDWSPDGR